MFNGYFYIAYAIWIFFGALFKFPWPSARNWVNNLIIEFEGQALWLVFRESIFLCPFCQLFFFGFNAIIPYLAVVWDQCRQNHIQELLLVSPPLFPFSYDVLISLYGTHYVLPAWFSYICIHNPCAAPLGPILTQCYHLIYFMWHKPFNLLEKYACLTMWF